MYVHPNFKTKKDLKQAVKDGLLIEIYAPGLGTPKTDGVETIEGPHYPAPHTWYAQVTLREGKIISVK